jgi:uncharacterized membrane protein (DUF4010 family)
MFDNPAYEVVWDFALAFAIGFLIGSERESATEEKAAGIRDFIIFSILGAIAGLLAEAWLTAATLLGIVAILVVYRVQHPERGGITTEASAVATFWLGYLTQGERAQLALALAILMVALLTAKKPLHRFVKETITEREYGDTLKFLTVVAIIYPLLPEGAYGPYEFFKPRQVWLFIIFISAVSYVGYFFTKFLGAERGLIFTGFLGGIASTTAATLAFARSAKENPPLVATYGRAAVVANAVQFPRILLILLAINSSFARYCLAPLLLMSLAGFLLSIFLSRVGRDAAAEERNQIPLKNPFSFGPVLKFGALFTAILFFTKICIATFGQRGVFVTSFIGGILDVDAIALSLGDLLIKHQEVTTNEGLVALLLALAANGLLKSLIAWQAGSLAFAWRLVAAFGLMFAVGVLSVLMGAGAL